MKPHNDAQKNSPQQERQSTRGKQPDSQDQRGHEMKFRDPHVKLVLGKVRHIAIERRSILAQSVANQDPAHMRPPLSIGWSVRVSLFIRELMMRAMCGYPKERTAPHGRHRADCQEILDPLGSSEAAMGKQPVITHPDSQTACDP